MAKAKAGYVDGFVLLVPKKNVATYKKMARAMEKMCKKHGALDYKECKGEDMRPKGMGGSTFVHFPDMAKAKKGEEVWFSFIVYKSRKHRDQVNKLVMKEMEKDAEKYKDIPMPFDMARLAYGGFTVEVGA